MKTIQNCLLFLMITFFLSCENNKNTTSKIFNQQWKLTNFESNNVASIESFSIALAAQTSATSSYEFSKQSVQIMNSSTNEKTNLKCKWSADEDSLFVYVDNLVERYKVTYDEAKDELRLLGKNKAVLIYKKANK